MRFFDTFTIRNFLPEDIGPIFTLQQKYAQAFPGVPVYPGEVYLSPGFAGGKNVLCGLDEQGCLCGVASLYPQLARPGSDFPHHLWAEIKLDNKLDPGLGPAGSLWNLLFEKLVARAGEIGREFPGHAVEFVLQFLPIEKPAIEAALAKGCIHRESIFKMARDLRLEIPRSPVPAGIEIRRWKMESEAEQQAYIQARNEAFPESPTSLADWQFFMLSPLWAVGTTFTAFDGQEIAGSAAVFWDEAENERLRKKVGATEYIFVRPAWQRRGIARALIGEGLAFLKEHGLSEAQLEVRAQNSQALNLYRDLGYQVRQETGLYILNLVR